MRGGLQRVHIERNFVKPEKLAVRATQQRWDKQFFFLSQTWPPIYTMLISIYIFCFFVRRPWTGFESRQWLERRGHQGSVSKICLPTNSLVVESKGASVLCFSREKRVRAMRRCTEVRCIREIQVGEVNVGGKSRWELSRSIRLWRHVIEEYEPLETCYHVSVFRLTAIHLHHPRGTLLR